MLSLLSNVIKADRLVVACECLLCILALLYSYFRSSVCAVNFRCVDIPVEIQYLGNV